MVESKETSLPTLEEFDAHQMSVPIQEMKTLFDEQSKGLQQGKPVDLFHSLFLFIQELLTATLHLFKNAFGMVLQIPKTNPLVMATSHLGTFLTKLTQELYTMANSMGLVRIGHLISDSIQILVVYEYKGGNIHIREMRNGVLHGKETFYKG